MLVRQPAHVSEVELNVYFVSTDRVYSLLSKLKVPSDIIYKNGLIRVYQINVITIPGEKLFAQIVLYVNKTEHTTNLIDYTCLLDVHKVY